jgi:uncharacterized protein YcfJ
LSLAKAAYPGSEDLERSHVMHPFTPSATALIAALVGPLAAHAAEFATVVSSTPVTASVPVARQLCSDSQQLVQQRPSGAGAVIGAIAGGVIGHNLGNGFGRAAATGLGVVAGSVVGDQVEAANTPVSEVPVRRCQTVSSYETRVVGYDVMYEYAGQRYSTRMARDPGTQLAVNVQPADSGGLPAPADAGRDGTPVPATPAPQTVYYAPAPQTVYYAPAPVYVTPAISFGFGYYGGYRGHWR